MIRSLLSKLIIVLALTYVVITPVPVQGHSWVEELMVIASNGTFVGDPGYPRGFISRDSASFNDADMDWLLPPDGRLNRLNSSMSLCRPSQQTRKQQSSGFARLSATPGSAVALRYQENGHVTQPLIPPGKPIGSGVVFVYGTSEPQDDEKFLDVHGKWNAAGTGGNGRGRLLATRNFDDGRCYQINSSPISQTRQKLFAHEADSLMGTNMWCQIDVAIPEDVEDVYTLYWVWDWSTLQTGTSVSKLEFYTSCMDVSINSSMHNYDSNSLHYAQGQNLNFAAIPSYLKDLDAVTATATVGSTSTSASITTSSISTSSSNSSGATTAAESPASITVAASSISTSYPSPSLQATSSSGGIDVVPIPLPFTIIFAEREAVVTAVQSPATPTAWRPRYGGFPGRR